MGSEGNLGLGHDGFEIAMARAERSQQAVDSQVLGPGERTGLGQKIRSTGPQMVTKASGMDYITQGSCER